MGCCPSKLSVIENGFYVSLFRPNAEQRVSFRHELRVSESTCVIGNIGRYDPVKGHRTLFEAIELIALTECEFLFVIIGRDVSMASDLQVLLHKPEVRKKLMILPERADMPHIMNGLDVLCLSSYSEGFPNVVAEAMSCGVPCVVTNVGDAAVIVSDTGYVVPPSDAIALAEALRSMIIMRRAERVQMGEQARKRIVENYSIEKASERYWTLYHELLLKKIRHNT